MAAMVRSPAPIGAAPDRVADARTLLLEAALLLFRRHGYHGVGVNEILASSGISKGSLYHHFPDGKQELAVAVVHYLSDRVLTLIDADHSPTTAQMVRRVGVSTARWMQSTGDDTRALMASFVTEGSALQALSAAVSTAYGAVAQRLQVRLQADGFPKAAARERAQLVLALFEGGGLLSQAQGQPQLFTRAIECAALLCERPDVSPSEK